MFYYYNKTDWIFVPITYESLVDKMYCRLKYIVVDQLTMIIYHAKIGQAFTKKNGMMN